jgi:hypothetical protein
MVWSGPRVRTGQVYAVRFWMKLQPIVGSDRSRVQDGYEFDHSPVRSGPRLRIGPERIGPDNSFQNSNGNYLQPRSLLLSLRTYRQTDIFIYIYIFFFYEQHIPILDFLYTQSDINKENRDRISQFLRT